jgi:hypothetical protein
MDTPYTQGASKAFLRPIAQDMLALGRSGRTIPVMIRRLLSLVVLLALFIFVLSYFQAIEVSYLDLVDSMTPDDPDHLTISITTQVTPLTSQPKPALPDNACNDESGWIEEWISSGVMPKCSLAHRSTVDVVYTYLPNQLK